MPSWQEPNKPEGIAHQWRSSGLAAQRSRVSLLALQLAVGVLLAGCAATSDPQAALCTSAIGEKTSALCDGPKRPVSLTMPRADLLKKVDIVDETKSEAKEPTLAADPVVTGAVNAAPTDRPASAVRRFFSALASSAEVPSGAELTAADGEKPAEGAVPEKSTDAKAETKPETKDEPEKSASKDMPVAPPPADRPVKEPKPGADSHVTREERIGTRDAMFSGTLSEAVRRAVGDHPLIGLAGARVGEALAGVGLAESALFPQLEGRLGAGPGTSGTFQDSTTRSYWGGPKNISGAARGEASLAGRQLLYDFGAVRSDIAKTSAQYDSEALKLREQTDAVTGQVADIYLKILEQRELLAAASENVTALEKIVKLVEENEKNGNGTVADMKRVRSRLIDSQSAVADARSELQTGSDRFARLVHARPGTLKATALNPNLIPRTPEAVIRVVKQGNPRMQALEASLKAARHEIDAQKASVMPKLALETDIGVKEYRSLKDRTELDAKGMIVLKYKFLDGGQHSNALEQLNSRLVQAEMRMRSEADDIEADIRKQYRILDVARAKAASLTDNVATAHKARQLYDEQFRGGKRTLLELLDIQTTYYTARRTSITNKFEEQRAIHGVLQAMGRLSSTMLGAQPRVASAKSRR